MARFWVYATTPRTCGRCGRKIPGGEVALKLRLQSAPHVGIWRCTDCVGQPPAEVIAEAEAAASAAAADPASLLERLAAIRDRVLGPRFDFDGKRR
jgi:hypothetical protein